MPDQSSFNIQHILQRSMIIVVATNGSKQHLLPHENSPFRSSANTAHRRIDSHRENSQVPFILSSADEHLISPAHTSTATSKIS